VKAVVIAEPSGPRGVCLRDVPAPEPGAGEVRVRVRATAVNRADVLQTYGRYPAPPGVPPDIPGLELAGEIDTLGAGTVGLSVGDRVFGLVGGGAYAEQIVMDARTVAKIPDALGFREAAAVPEAFITAYDAMVTRAGLRAGESVLIHAVASGVGTAALQIARTLGARPIGTSRTKDKLDRARALGLTDALLVETADFAPAVTRMTGGKGADVVLELVGASYFAADVACAAHRGRIVVVGLVGGAKVELDLGVVLRKRLSIHGTVLRARPLEEKVEVTQTFAREIVPRLARGELAPVVDRVFDLSHAGDALTYIEENRGFGKVVLEVPA
jgi:putative PIG3 family NAD(P)H quinone oxidoreductase